MASAAKDFGSDREILEALVRGRQSARLLKALPEFLREWSPGRPETVFQACDWLRRLGLYEEGLRYLDLDRPIRATEPASTPEGRRRLWIARFFNAIGARDYAVQLAGTIECTDEESFRIAGHIYLAHFDRTRAETLLAQAVRHARADGLEAGYLQRLTRVSWSDALYATGRREEAFETLREIPATGEESLLRAILGQAQGEYLARSGEYAEAARILRGAMALFPPGDRSPDRGVCLKWLGYARAMQGKRGLEEGRKYLDEAWSILKRPSISAEAWLDVLRLAGQSGVRPAATLARVARYPGLAPGFRDLLGSTPNLPPRPASGKWWVDLGTQEYRTPGGEWGLGIPVHLELAAQVSLAGDWGVHRARLQSLLWPRQAFSYFSLRNRLDQSLFRLRREEVGVSFEEGLLRLEPGQGGWVKASPGVEGGEEMPTQAAHLAASEGFVRAQIGELYGLSRTQAMLWIQRWMERGWIEARGKTRSLRYYLRQ